MNWNIIILISIAVIALIIFLIRRNMKDEEKFEDQLKEDYQKPRDTDVNDTSVD
jgi:hypothetical protein